MGNFNIGQKAGVTGNYIFIDTETANKNHDICQVGAIIISNGVIEDIIDFFVKPCETFESANIRKNNIYPDMVENAETFDVVWSKKIDKYVSTHIFVAHGASFDLTAIRKTLQFYGKNLPDIRYICTQQMAKKLSVPCESREDLCKYFNLCIDNNHNAFSDVKDCYNIFVKLYDLCSGEIDKFVQPHYNQKYMRSEITEDISIFIQRQASKFSTKKVNSLSFNEEIDLDFKNQKVTITGDFERFPRKDREKLANELRKRGAIVMSSSNLAKSTTMLIAGSGAGPSKIRKAKEYRIRIIDEETLYRMLEDNSAIVNAKCTNCNMELLIDDEKDADICLGCNTEFVIEKANKIYNLNGQQEELLRKENEEKLRIERQKQEEEKQKEFLRKQYGPPKFLFLKTFGIVFLIVCILYLIAR